jgi:hypothetical protein
MEQLDCRRSEYRTKGVASFAPSLTSAAICGEVKKMEFGPKMTAL